MVLFVYVDLKYNYFLLRSVLRGFLFFLRSVLRDFLFFLRSVLWDFLFFLRSVLFLRYFLFDKPPPWLSCVLLFSKLLSSVVVKTVLRFYAPPATENIRINDYFFLQNCCPLLLYFPTYLYLLDLNEKI